MLKMPRIKTYNLKTILRLPFFSLRPLSVLYIYLEHCRLQVHLFALCLVKAFLINEKLSVSKSYIGRVDIKSVLRIQQTSILSQISICFCVYLS